MIDDFDLSPNTFTMPCLMTYEIVRILRFANSAIKK
jgi:hypothetical protein